MKIKELKTVSIKEAVDILGENGLVISEEALRDGITCGAFPFGVCIINPDADIRKRNFYIFTALLKNWISERLDDVEYPDWFFSKGG